jgi:hypothetical protein
MARGARSSIALAVGKSPAGMVEIPATLRRQGRRGGDRGAAQQPLRAGTGAVSLHDALTRRGVLVEERSRPHRPRHELAAAVRAQATEAPLGAIGAERALERADARVPAPGREIPVAALAVRP